MKNKFLKDILFFGFGSLLSKLIIFFLLPLYTNKMTKSEFGLMELVNNYIVIIVPIISIQIAETSFRYILTTKKEKERKKLIFTFMVYPSILFSFFYFISGFTVLHFLEEQNFFRLNFNLLALCVFLVVYSSILKQITRGLDKSYVYSMSELIQTIALSASAITFVGFFDIGLKGYLYALAIGNFLSILYILIKINIKELFIINNIFNVNTIRILMYGIPLIPNVIANWLLNIADRLIIAKNFGLSDVALYALAFKYSTIFTIISSILIMSWQSRAIHIYNEQNKNKKESSEIFIQFLFFTTFLLFILILCAKSFMILTAPETYYFAWKYAILMLINSYILAFSSYYAASYIASLNTKKLFYSSLSIGTLNVLLNSFIIPSLGIIAGIFCTLISSTLLLLIRLNYSTKKIKIQYEFKKNLITFLLIIFSVIIVYLNINVFIETIIIVAIIIIYILLNIKFLKNMLKQFRQKE